MLISFTAGSNRAFEEIHARYFDYLYQLALRKTGDEDAAWNISQEVFISLYNTRSRGIDNLKAYLYTLTKNRVQDFYRRQAVRNQYRQQLLKESSTLYTLDVEQAFDKKELEQKIAGVVKTLPEQCRRVFLLSREEGLTYEQIASLLNISVNTVDQHIRKALRHLRIKLEYYIVIGLALGML